MKGTGNSAGLRIGGEETITFVKAVKKNIFDSQHQRIGKNSKMGAQNTSIIVIFIVTLACQGTTALDLVEETHDDDISGLLSTSTYARSK